MQKRPQNVTIIGAGLAGCALALCLQQHSIPVRIFESRTSDALEISSGVILTPNGLHILDRLGIYARIKDICWLGKYRTFKNDKDETTKKILVAGAESYGYANHRVWRRLLLAEMKSLLSEKGIEVIYESRFEGIVHDDDERDDVGFMVNGKEKTADLLIGADGIYSTVRKYLDPGIAPEYTGVVGIISHIKWDTVQWPYEGFERQCTIQGKPGALVLMPEVKDGSEIMVAMQAKYPDQGRVGFEAMASDINALTTFFRAGYADWHDTGKNIIDSVCTYTDKLYLWPYYRIPTMQRWFSESGRVIILGDAAHAVPPSSGQGINQALEDVWSLTRLLVSGRDLTQALRFWQDVRQMRVDAVYDWAVNGANVQRMPEVERLKVVEARKGKDSMGLDNFDNFDDMRWLYMPSTERDIELWIQKNV